MKRDVGERRHLREEDAEADRVGWPTSCAVPEVRGDSAPPDR